MKTAQPSRSYGGLTPEQLQTEATSVAQKLEELRAQIAQLNGQCSQMVADQQAIADEQAQLKLALQGPVDWAWVLAEDPESSPVRHRAASKAVRQVAEYQGHAGLSADGTNAHTGQRVPKVALLRGVPALTRQVCAALEQLLPFIQPCSPETGSNEAIKYLSVFEASLSEHGTYFLAIDEACSTFQLRRRRFGRTLMVHSAPTLAGLLDFVEQHCYYEDWTQRAA